MECALFYPRVVPPKAWIKQSLLYWDMVGSVVHRDFWDDPDPDIAWLAERGHYETVHVDDVSREASKQIADEFIEVLASFEDRGIDWGPGNGPHESIHYGKLPQLVELQMKELGVAREERNGLRINSRLLAPFICILAKYASVDFSETGRSYSLHTDDEKAYAVTFGPLAGEPSPRQVLGFTLRNVLPVPGGSVPFEDILSFKETHQDSLSLLRMLLTRTVRDGLRDGLSGEEILADISAGIQKEQLVLLRAFNRSDWKFWFTTASFIVGTAVGHVVNPQSTQWVMDGIGTAMLSMMAVKTRNGPAPEFVYLHDAQWSLACPK